MSRIHIEHLYRVDLDGGVAEYAISEPLMHQDARADVFTAVLRRGMTPADLTGTEAMAYIIFAATKQTLALDGTISGSSVSVTLDEACYAIPGGFRMALQLIQGDTRRTVLAVTGEIRRTATDCVITGTEVVPTLPELLARIDDVTQAASAANSAAEEAILAACDARQAAGDVLLSSAPPIVCSAVGPLVTVPDAAQGRAFPALSLMGKTTQAGTPSPSAPVELVSIPVGSVTAHVAGVNLLRWEALTVPEATTVADDGSITVANDSTSKTYYPRTTGIYLPAGTFTLSVSRQYASAMLYFRPEGSATPDSIARITGSSSATFTIQAGWYEIMFTVDPGTSETLRIQLQTGSAATAYEPPVLGAASLTLTNSLRGVPVTSGGNYTDENGQQWICDEVDLMRGKLIRRVAQVDFDGSENWVTSGTNASGFVVWLSKTDEPHLDKSAILCNRCGYAAGSSASNPSGTTFGIQRGGSNNNIQFFVPYSMCADLSAWKALVKQWHDAGAPLCKVYTAAFPVETDLSADEVAAFLQLRSPYGPMTVYNDAGAGLQVSYVADTKLYIDQKMAAIAQAVLNM